MAAKKKAPAKKAAPKKPIQNVAPQVWVVDGVRYFTLNDAEDAARG